MNKFKEIIMKDIGWKILSVMIAICLWFVVINIQNPVENRTFNVPVEFQNRDLLIQNGLVMVNNKDFVNLKVSVKVRGQRMSLDRLNTKNIEAVVDLKKVVSTGTQTKEFSAPITVTLPGIVGDTCQITSKDPQYVNLVVDNVITVEKAVEIKISGTTSNGYVMSSPVSNPAVVTVSGAEADVERVDSVQAEISIHSISDDVTLKAVPIPYDANGEEVTGVLISEKEIGVSINVKKSKSVPVKVMTQGLPSYRYKVVHLSWEPMSIEVVGEAAVLDSLTEIVLPVINIQNRTESLEESYSVERLLPEGVQVKSGTKKSVTVTVEIAQEITKMFRIPGEQISTTGNLAEKRTATFSPQAVDLLLIGTKSAIDSVDISKILGTLEISNLDVGEHLIPLQFTLPEGVEIVGTAPDILVTITQEGESDIQQGETIPSPEEPVIDNPSQEEPEAEPEPEPVEIPPSELDE